VNAATGYHRHEGGILNPDGTFVHSSFGEMFSGLELAGKIDLQEYAFAQVNARRNVLQQRGEVSRVTSETLLDAANTYIDLLAARSGQTVAGEIENRLKDLLTRAEKYTSVEPTGKFEVARIKAELDNQRRIILTLEEQANAATYKLNYLLGLDPCTQLIPVDNRLVPFELIDATPPACDLINQALTTGPGVEEMEELLTLIHQSIERSKGLARLLPFFQVGAAEGVFVGGPGDDEHTDNRLDLGVQVGWNLTNLLTRCDRDKVIAAKAAQAHLAYQDLRGKLAAGVQEAREAVLSGRDQIRMAEAQMDDAGQAYGLAHKRLENAISGASADTALAIDSLARAQVNYINSTSAYDKAQLRLMILMGPESAIHCLPHQ
jgi:outer membrane protein TolC